MTSNPQFDAVAEVNTKFGHAVRTNPGLGYEDVSKRLDIFVEEALETISAYRMYKFAMARGDQALVDEATVEFLDGLADILVTLYGLAQATGMPITEAFDAVTAANLTKLDDNGNPIYSVPGDSTSKYIKGPNYVAPTEDLKKLLGF